MRRIVVNDGLANDRLSVSLTPGQAYQLILNTPVLTPQPQLVAGAPPSPALSYTETGYHTFDMIIRDQETNLPLSGVTVTLVYPDGREEEVTSDSAGRIYLEGRPHPTVTIADVRK